MKIFLKKFLSLAITLVAFIFLAIVANYFNLQKPMNQVLEGDPRNSGIKVSVHYKWLILPSKLEYNITELKESSPIDVSRVLLQFSEKMKDKEFDKVYLGYKGVNKFYLQGEYFKTLGNEYGRQNPIYTLRTMPENVYNLNGEHAYEQWEGGVLGVMQKQLEDLNSFAEDWYIKDIKS